MRSLVVLAALCSIASAQPPANQREPGAELKVAGIVVAGTGVVALGTSMLFAISASDRSEEVTDAPVWDQAFFDGGRMAERNAKIMLGVGTAVVAGGVVMYLLGREQARQATQISVTPTRGGAALVWSCDL